MHERVNTVSKNISNSSEIFVYRRKVLDQIQQRKTEDDELDPVAMANIFSEKVRY